MSSEMQKEDGRAEASSPLRNVFYVLFTMVVFVAGLAFVAQTMPRDDLASSLEFSKASH